MHSLWTHFPFVVGCLFFVSLLIMVRQFAHPHFASCVIDDSILQMSWVRQFTEVLSEGVWLPRWLPHSNGGYGSPVFVFYPPLVYYVTAGLQLAGISVILSMKLVRFLGLWLSGVAMFVFARGFVGSGGALAVALVYLSLPFHVLNISYWTLYAEPWAWIWFPLILHFLEKMLQREKQGLVLSYGVAFCYLGLILTHLVSAYMFSFVMAAYVWFGSGSGRRLRDSLSFSISAGAGLALAAFFLFPAFYERRLVHIEYSTLLPEFDFRNTFLFFPNSVLTKENAFQARTIFLLQCITLIQLAGLLVAKGVVRQSKNHGRFDRLLWFAFWAALCCLLLMSRASLWIWEWVPGLPQIQFSTRWLSIYTLMTSLLMGATFRSFGQNESKSASGAWLKLAFFTVALLSGLGSFVIARESCFLSSEEVRKAEMNLYNAPEYNPLSMPKWSQRVIAPEGHKWWVTEGSANIELRQWRAHKRELAIEAHSQVVLKLRLYNYPGWNIQLDGVETLAKADPADGRISVRIPPGHHFLKLNFENTAWRTMSLLVSVMCAAVMLIYRAWN
jgi:hypothetical protein